jgi:hypothetical protein
MPISLEPMEIAELEYPEEKSINMMKRDLNEYRKRMLNKATFKGWIAHVCPENITIDKKLEEEESEWLKLWNESNKRLTRKRSLLRQKKNQTAKEKIN